MVVDPVLRLALQLLFCGLFARAAWHKIVASAAFTAALRGYRVLPERALRPAARALAAGEGIVALGLLVPAWTDAAAWAGAALLSLYGAAIAHAWWRGLRDIDCGCGAPGEERPIGPELVARNALLAVVLGLLATWPVAPRTLGWLDAAMLLPGLVAAALVHGAAERSLVLARAQRAWRRSA